MKRTRSITASNTGISQESLRKARKQSELPTDPRAALTNKFREFIASLDDNLYTLAQRRQRLVRAIQFMYVWVSNYSKAVLKEDFLGMIKAEIKILDQFEYIDKILEIPEFTEILKEVLIVRKERELNQDTPIEAAEYIAAISARRLRAIDIEDALELHATHVIDIPPLSDELWFE